MKNNLYRIFILFFLCMQGYLYCQSITFDAVKSESNSKNEKASNFKCEIYGSDRYDNPIDIIEPSGFFSKSNKIKFNPKKLFKKGYKTLYLRFTYIDKKNPVVLYDDITCILKKKWFDENDKIRDRVFFKSKHNNTKNIKIIRNESPYQFRLLFWKAQTVISGKILDINNNPIEDVTIVLLSVISTIDGDQGGGDVYKTDTKGNFSINKLFKTDSPSLIIKLILIKPKYIPEYKKMTINNRKINKNNNFSMDRSDEAIQFPEELCYRERDSCKEFSEKCQDCVCPENLPQWYPEIRRCDIKCPEGQFPKFKSYSENYSNCEKSVAICLDDVVAPLPPPITSYKKFLEIEIDNSQGITMENMEVYHSDMIDDSPEYDTIDKDHESGKVWKIGKIEGRNLIVDREHRPKEIVEGKDRCQCPKLFLFDTQLFDAGVSASFFVKNDINKRLYIFTLDKEYDYEGTNIDLSISKHIKLKLGLNIESGVFNITNLEDFISSDDTLNDKNGFNSQFSPNRSNENDNNCDKLLQNINNVYSDCEWEHSLEIWKNKDVLNSCQYFFQNAEGTRKIITILNKYFLSQGDIDFSLYTVDDMKNQIEMIDLMGQLLALYNYFDILEKSHSMKEVGYCDYSKYYLDKSNALYKLFYTMLIEKFISPKISNKTVSMVDRLELCLDCTDKFKEPIGKVNGITLDELAELAEISFKKYDKISLKAQNVEGCEKIPVDKELARIKKHLNP